MHDDVLASLDRYLGELRLIREGLVSARPVRPGERRVALVRAVRTSERFQREASHLLGDTAPTCLCLAPDLHLECGERGERGDRTRRDCVHADHSPAVRR